MTKEHKAKISGKNIKTAIIVSRFNEFVTKNLLNSAIECLEHHGVSNDSIEIYWVPGAFEIPKLAQITANSGRFDGIICLGAVIRGETPHFEYISSETARGIGRVAMQANIPVVFGVLTTDTVEQALKRAGDKLSNKGWDSAVTMMDMIEMYKIAKM